MTTGRRERSQGISGFLCLLLSLGVLLGAATVLQAQERTGTLTGQLKDEQGGVLPGATVVITNLQTGRVTRLQTDGQGMYRADVEPGRYSVQYELSGFARQEVPEVNMLLGRTFTINAAMRLGAVTETVQVTAEAVPQIDVRSTVVAHNVTSEEIDRLPKTRSFQSIALTAPSVNQGEVEGGFQVNGASGAENAFTVDGVVTNSLVYGSSRQDTVFEYLQEVQVKTTGISAEYGGALGGVLSAVTKSGGNTVVGEVHYLYEGSGLSAGPVKRLNLSPIDDRTVTYFQDEENPDHRNEPGGSIGGPILRDRLFYFASYSPRFERRTRLYRYSNGTDPGEIRREITRQQLFGKLTFTNNRLSTNWSALWTPSEAKGSHFGYSGTGPNFHIASKASDAANATRGWEINQVNTSGTVDLKLTNASSLSGRAGLFHDRYSDTGIPLTTSYLYQTPNFGLAGVPASLQGGIGTQNTPRAQITGFDTTRRGFFNVDYNHAFNAGGLHTLKGGVGFQRTTNEINSFYPGGYVLIFWDRSFAFGGVTRGRGTYGYYEVNDRTIGGNVGGDITSLYVQDQWTVGDRLTLNLGLRTENERIPSFRPEIVKYAIKFGFADKIAPRLGATYDLRGDGRVKVYGSWGRYFDWTKYELPRGSFGSERWCIFYRGLDTLDIGSLNLTNKPGPDLWTVPGGCRDRRVPSFVETIEPDLKPMSQDSTSVGLEYQLFANSVLTVHYVHNDLRETIEDVGFLTPVGDEGYLIANPGLGQTTSQFPSGATPLGQRVPRPKRQYDAFEIGINRRFANNFFWSANYTISRLYGNYGGLASSDEITPPTTGFGSATAQQQASSIARPGTNANRAWDLDELLWDSHGNLDLRGRLATDRPHVVKLYGAYQFPVGTQVGGFFYGGSGTPVTTYLSTTHTSGGMGAMVEGRGDLGRTPVLTRTDLLVSHELPLAGARRLRFELNVLNVFNQKTARYIYSHLNHGAALPRTSAAADLSDVDLTKGYDYNALILASPEGAGAYETRYRQADIFEPGARGYFTIKYLF